MLYHFSLSPSPISSCWWGRWTASLQLLQVAHQDICPVIIQWFHDVIPDKKGVKVKQNDHQHSDVILIL